MRTPSDIAQSGRSAVIPVQEKVIDEIIITIVL